LASLSNTSCLPDCAGEQARYGAGPFTPTSRRALLPKMFDTILIANRGEIACRIIRTARRMRVRTVAVHSRADANALHVQMADGAVAIGPSPAAKSYLNGTAILAAAKASGAQAIHPGYGFLSENAEFSEACADGGLIFIGPPPDAIRAMGLKDRAKALMQAAGVPVTPGYYGEEQADEVLSQEAERIGYPVLIKAVAGGGGKGMRRVEKARDFESALASARREAKASFGNERVLIEKWITAPRHVEIQIMADAHGNIVHLNERDCSMQRRHQKVIEEAPAPGIGPDRREAMGKAAIDAARAIGYTGAGTVEFIVDASDGSFYFMEMNTRLQVEHPVTEAITGLDLVELQLRVAAGEPLGFSQDDVRIDGHAIEARIYAEDPDNNFLPSTGTIAHLRLPGGDGIRVDAGVAEGAKISAWYDPMIAKIIAHGSTRDEARTRLEQALAQSQIAGPKTNIAFLQQAIAAPPFASGAYTTATLESAAKTRPSAKLGVDASLVRIAALALVDREMQQQEAPADDNPSSPWDDRRGYQLSGLRHQLKSFTIGGVLHQVTLVWQPFGVIEAKAGGNISTGQHLREARDTGALIDTAHGLFLRDGADWFAIEPVDHTTAGSAVAGDSSSIASPMHGRLTAVMAAPGDSVARGAALAIVEAMKMEHVLVAPRDGIVDTVAMTEGAQVSQGAIIMTLRPADDDRDNRKRDGKAKQ